MPEEIPQKTLGEHELERLHRLLAKARPDQKLKIESDIRKMVEWMQPPPELPPAVCFQNN